MNERMEYAMEMAEKCWGRAVMDSPDFVYKYLQCAEELLVRNMMVTGDQFRSFCDEQGVSLPDTLHHNTWVSGVRALQLMSWIEPVTKVTPEKSHNHMPEVTLWRSKLYGKQSSGVFPRQMSLLA